MSRLFRDEVIEAKRKRLYGRLIVRTPARLVAAVWCLIAAGLLGGGFALSRDFTRWEVVDGYLYPNRGVAKITASRVGTVSKVFVADGQRVKAGTPILEISIRDFGSSDEGARRHMRELIAAQEEIAENQSLLVRQQIGNQTGQSRARLLAGRSQLAELSGQVALQAQKVEALESAFGGLAQTLDKGFISKRDYNIRLAELLTEKQSLSQLAERRNELEATVAALAIETGSSALQQHIESGALKKDLLHFSEAEAGLSKDERYVITAPVDGVVTALSAKPGAAAEERATLGYIVPADAPVEAVLLVPTRSAGFLRPGQEVRMEYEAFPYQQFGRYQGTVAAISRTISAPGEQSGPVTPKEPTFRVSARLQRQTVDAYGRPVPLPVGMLLKARIATRRQRILDWLLEPLRAAGSI
ncbi:MAG: HlyD family secretion protein [Allosphingosinicella sp.]